MAAKAADGLSYVLKAGATTRRGYVHSRVRRIVDSEDDDE